MLSYFCYLFTFWSSKERDAGIKNPHLCASKDKQLATGSLSKVKEQGYDTGVTFHIHLLQRTACIHTAKLPYCHQQSYTQTDSWTQSVASVTQNVAGKGADQPRAVPWMHHNMQDEWRACYCLGPCPELLQLTRADISAQLQKYLHTQGGKEGGEGSRATSLCSTISLCQLMLFMEFQLSPDNSTIDRPPPGLHWESTQQCQPTKSDTPALNREQEHSCFALHLYFAITSTASQRCGL